MRDAPPDETIAWNSTHTNNPINKKIIDHLHKSNFAASVPPHMQFLETHYPTIRSACVLFHQLIQFHTHAAPAALLELSHAGSLRRRLTVCMHLQITDVHPINLQVHTTTVQRHAHQPQNGHTHADWFTTTASPLSPLKSTTHSTPASLRI